MSDSPQAPDSGISPSTGTGTRPGTHRTFDRGPLVGIAVVVALLIVNAGLAYRNTRQLRDDAALVAHTHEVLDTTSDVLRTMLDAETGQRGFLITGREEFLEPYHDALNQLGERMGRLQRLTSDNPRQQAHIVRLEVLKDERLALLSEGIELRRRSAAEAQQFVTTRKGKAQMDAIRALVADMEQEEEQLLADRKRRSDAAYAWAVTTGWLAAGLGLVVFAGFVWLLRRSLLARARAAAVLHEQREWLRTTLASIGDAVIATDPDGRVAFLNPVAQALTGWAEQEARGAPLERVFAIVNEQTRRPVENPAMRALRDGRIVGLANHTVLISRDGKEIPIDDSAAPIRGEKGALVGAVLIFRDITARRRAEAALRESEARYKALVEATAQIVWTTDSTGRVVADSPSWRAFTGQTYEQWQGWGWLQALHPDDREPAAQAWMRATADGSIYQTEYRLRTPDGSYRMMLARGVPVRGADGRVVEWVGMNVDITDRRRAEEALREADRRKDEFLATLAHELRNPLAPIRNALQVLRLAGDNEAMKEQARAMMERQLQQMVRLIDDLLDVSRITRDKLHLRKQWVELEAVVHGAVETSRPLIEAAGHELTVSLPPGPVLLDADATRLAQVFANLLNNSAKYTPRGGRIRLTAEREDGPSPAVVVRVRDTGVGIPADMVSRVFEMFMQVDRSLEKSQGGLGIGLTLVKRLVEMHGGSVEAHSDGPGKGSEFVVRLPVVQMPTAGGDRPADGDGVKESPGSAYRILVADDNEDSATSMSLLLKMMGHDVRTANDGAEAVAAAAEFRPAVAILDIGMPRLNGYDAARRIREQPGGKGMVLIALTGWGQEEDKLRAREAGFDHHLTKPVRSADLEQILLGIRFAASPAN